MTLFRIRDYPVGVSDGDGKVGVVPRTTYLTSQKVYFWIDGENFVLSSSREYSSMSNYYKDRYYSS